MREIEAVIEQIQSVLAWEHDPDQEYMETLVADYSRNVSVANERLRTCEALLSKGLRTEAIQQCETEPNLLDLTAVLDFPEIEFWSDYVSQYELPPLPELLLEVASDLNDAYASAQPVSGLLKLHRLHALALSPLSVRIQILRELANKDKDNPLWLEDLEVYEVARQNQIESELENVLANKNTTQAAALEAELASRKWSNRPPNDLIRKVQTVRVRLQMYDARKELKNVAEALNNAFLARDLDTARHHAQRWESLIATAEIQEGEPIFETTELALEWITEEEQKELQKDAYQNSITALERSLDRDSSVDELDRSAKAISLFDLGIPEELERRLEERKTQIGRQTSRRTAMIVAGIAATALVICSILLSLMLQYRHGQSIRNHAQTLRQLLTDEHIEQAEEFCSQLRSESPDVAESPELQLLYGELSEILSTAQERRNSFLKLLSAATDQLGSSPDWDRISQAMEVLKRAESMAKDDGERNEVEEARNVLERARQLAQSAADTLFLADLDAVMIRFQERTENDMKSNQLLTDDFRGLQRRAHVSENHKIPITAILRTLGNARAEHQRSMKVAADLNTITASVGNVDRYRTQLLAYVRNHSGTKRATTFQSVISSESDLWKGPELWNQLRDQWASLSLKDVNPTTAGNLQLEFAKFMKVSNEFPAGRNLARQAEALKAVNLRVGDHGDLQEQLRAPLEFYLQLPFMVAQGDDRYYSDSEEPPLETGDVITIVPFRDTTLKRAAVKRVLKGSVSNKQAGLKFIWDAPPAVFARTALRELETVNEHWEESFGKLVTLLAEDLEIDPIVKMKLLLNVMNVGARGSLFFREAFQEHITAIDQFEGGDANWIWPAGSGAPSARINARAILGEMSPVAQAAEKAVTMRDEVAKLKPGPVYRWVGWLYRSQDDRWNCSTNTRLQPADNGALVVMVSLNNQQPPSRFAPIGSVVAGTVALDSSADSTGFIEGRPVFLTEQ
ncbi:MAG: hypothetical protein MK110_08250 [Fuerstiella sp.]|nr:hypothetical protein [Fuerstiella sp.]